MNAAHARENELVDARRRWRCCSGNSSAAAAAIRALTDAELDRAATVSLYSDAPLTCQFVLEDHAVRHSYHHLAGNQAGVEARSRDRRRCYSADAMTGQQGGGRPAAMRSGPGDYAPPYDYSSGALPPNVQNRYLMLNWPCVPGLPEVGLAVARIEGVRARRRRQDQRVVVVALGEVDVRQVDGRVGPRQAGALVERVEDVGRRLLVEEVDHVQLEPNPLRPPTCQLVRDEQVGAGQERRAAHVAAAVHEHRDGVGRVHDRAHRRAAAGVDEAADLGAERQACRSRRTSRRPDDRWRDGRARRGCRANPTRARRGPTPVLPRCPGARCCRPAAGRSPRTCRSSASRFRPSSPARHSCHRAG